MDTEALKECKNPQCKCRYVPTPEYWPRDKGEPDGLSIYCHECNRDRASADYAKNRFEILEKRYQAYHDPAKHADKKAYFAQKRREYRQRDAMVG